MSLSPQFLDELRSRTLLSALVGRSVKIQKAGREFKGCCPFHNEKTPSFYVNDEKGFYHASRHHGVIYSEFNEYWLKRIDGFRRVPLNTQIAQK